MLTHVVVVQRSTDDVDKQSDAAADDDDDDDDADAGVNQRLATSTHVICINELPVSSKFYRKEATDERT